MQGSLPCGTGAFNFPIICPRMPELVRGCAAFPEQVRASGDVSTSQIYLYFLKLNSPVWEGFLTPMGLQLGVEGCR